MPINELPEVAKEVFDAAKEARDKKKQAEENAQSGSFGDFQQLKYVGLEDDKEVAFRIVSIPLEMCEDHPIGTKLILQSDILKDNEKGYIKVNWPWVQRESDMREIPDPEWILTRLYNKVREGVWKKFTEEDLKRPGFYKDESNTIRDENKRTGEYDHYHRGTKCYAKLSDAGNTKTAGEYQGKKIYKRVYPGKNVLVNAIHRNDSWCADNKHTKLLATKVGQKDYAQDDGTTKTVYFPSTGISITLYDKIFETFSNTGWTMDCVIKKYKKRGSDQRDYLITKASHTEDLSEELQKIVSREPLTDAEKEYDYYDLNKLFSVCSYRKLKANLKGLFKLVDSELSCDFYDQLEELVLKEKEANEAKSKEELAKEVDASESVDQTEETETPKEETVTEEPTPETKVETKEEPVTEPAVQGASKEDSCKIFYKSWDKLPDTEKRDMSASIEKFQDGKPVFKDPGNLMDCDSDGCEAKFPESVYTCPVCGTVDAGE